MGLKGLRALGGRTPKLQKKKGPEAQTEGRNPESPKAEHPRHRSYPNSELHRGLGLSGFRV